MNIRSLTGTALEIVKRRPRTTLAALGLASVVAAGLGVKRSGAPSDNDTYVNYAFQRLPYECNELHGSIYPMGVDERGQWFVIPFDSREHGPIQSDVYKKVYMETGDVLLQDNRYPLKSRIPGATVSIQPSPDDRDFLKDAAPCFKEAHKSFPRPQ